jgi:hypothetical protein
VLLKPEVLDRLLLSKSFLDRIRFQPAAVHDRHKLAANIIAAHDAAELAIAAIAHERGCSPANGGKTYLMDYFDPIEKTTEIPVHGRDYFRQLNGVRSLLKHQGLYPDAKQWARVAETVFECRLVFSPLSFPLQSCGGPYILSTNPGCRGQP